MCFILTDQAAILVSKSTKKLFRMGTNALSLKLIGLKDITERLRLWKLRKSGRRLQKFTHLVNKPVLEISR